MDRGIHYRRAELFALVQRLPTPYLTDLQKPRPSDGVSLSWEKKASARQLLFRLPQRNHKGTMGVGCGSFLADGYFPVEEFEGWQGRSSLSRE
jgi:hypothetical protein